METIRNNIDNIILFLQPNIPCVNTHTVHFIIEKLWETTIPNNILNELNNSSNFEAFLEKFWNCKKNYEENVLNSEEEKVLNSNSELANFFLEANKYRLTSLMNSDNIITVEELLNKLNNKKKGEIVKSVKINQLMSEKKSYEVDIMSQIVAVITNTYDSSHIVDLGGGQGYLSSILAIQHGKKTLSLDFNQTNTHGAAVRSKKLEKLWIRTQKRQEKYPDKEHHGKNWKRKTNAEVVTIKDEELVICKDNIKQVTHFVTPKSDISSILNEAYPSDMFHNVSLIGLHTCGDLSATSLRLFTQCSTLQCLVQVGCCYHLMEEEFIKSPFWKEVNESLYEHGYGFPLSDYLRQRKFFLGRNVRMSGTQSPERVIDLKQTQTLPLFYRALLEKYLRSKISISEEDPKVVGRLATKCNNFVEYVRKAVSKLNLDFEVIDTEITELYESHQKEYEYLQIYYLLKIALAPVIETLIVLDRLLYLYEQGIPESYIVQIFDPVVSPRCYAVISMKSNQETSEEATSKKLLDFSPSKKLKTQV